MEKSNNKSNSSSKLKHRFTRMLLGSSCTTTIAATTFGPAKCPITTPAYPEAELDPDRLPRPKLDQHSSFPRIAPVVSISINCGARRCVQASQPFLPLLNKELENDKKERRALTESVNFYEAKQRSKQAYERKKETSRMEAKKLLSKASGIISSSSLDSENEFCLFSSAEEKEEEDESGTLFSSKSFSSDSSEFYHNSRKKNKNTRSKCMKSTRRPPRRHVKHSGELRPLVSISPKEKEEKLEASETNASGFAVVKRSRDPYADFRSSMVEMIVERGMTRAGDLERLLRSYLTLNSPRHHQVILEAFADIWEAMFGE